MVTLIFPRGVVYMINVGHGIEMGWVTLNAESEMMYLTHREIAELGDALHLLLLIKEVASLRKKVSCPLKDIPDGVLLNIVFKSSLFGTNAYNVSFCNGVKLLPIEGVEVFQSYVYGIMKISDPDVCMYHTEKFIEKVESIHLSLSSRMSVK